MTHSISHSLLARHGYLLITLPGVLVLSVALLVFESSRSMTAGDFTNLIRSIVDSTHHTGAAYVLAEVRARYIWLATVMLNIVVPIYTTVLCGLIIYRAHSRRRLAVVVMVGVVLCAIGLVILLQSAATQNMLYRAVFGFTFLTLQDSGRFDPMFLARVHAIISLMNVLAVIVPVIAVLAAGSALAPPEDGDDLTPDYLTTQMRHLKEVLNAGSALLVTGILHMDAWLRWPASLVGEKGVQDGVLGVSLAITLFWGATFTLVLIATYGPAATHLGARARTLLRQEGFAEGIRDPDQWLKDHGLYFTLGEQLPQIGVMLAPLLAGPLGSLLMTPVTPIG
ncbi:MAG: hypothetical protein ACREJU_16580 [Nitrospiraceae bacterium]